MEKDLVHKVFYAGPNWKLSWLIQWSMRHVLLGAGIVNCLDWAGLMLYLGPLSLGLGVDRK